MEVIKNLELLKVDWGKPDRDGAIIVNEIGLGINFDHASTLQDQWLAIKLWVANVVGQWSAAGMASKLTLDRADPDVDAMVGGWIDGEEYEVRLRIRQVSSNPKAGQFDVLEVGNETEAPEPAEESYPARSGKPVITVAK